MSTPDIVAQLAQDSSSLYRQLAEFPTYKTGQFQGEGVLRVTTSTVDHENNTKRTSIKTYVQSGDIFVASISPDTPDVVASTLSPSGRYLAILRESSDASKPDGKTRSVEVWAEDKLQATQDVTDIHKGFFTDEYLSSIYFSPSESKLVYTAEAKTLDARSDPLAKYRFTPDFGESYGGKKHPAVFLFEWKKADNPKISQVALADPHAPTLLGHAVFGDEDKLLAIAYEYTVDGRLLGVIYCPNREASIWEITLPSGVREKGGNILKCDASKLTSSDMACRSPRVLLGTNGRPSYLVWVSNDVGGPHATCSTLHARNLTISETRVLIKTVWDPAPFEFPGLYLNTLPTHPFLNTPDPQAPPYIVLSSTWRSRSTILLVSVQAGTFVELTPPEKNALHSWTLISTNGINRLLCSRSAPNQPPELLLGSLNNDHKTVKWVIVSQPKIPDDLRAKLARLQTEVVPIPSREPTETIVVRDPSKGTQPSIIMPHGGPHSGNIVGFSAVSAALAIEGYVISYPGYTGSIGFGEKHVKELMGRIGTLDIEDCMTSLRHLEILGYTKFGPGQQYVMGGSHGGFITGHLIGQYPDFFSGAVLRNPVISLGELSYSDIPDWYFEESGIPYTSTSLVTPELYEKLWAMSPISHVDQVRAPVAILIGEKDQRVATTQGRSYYHALKGRGKHVEMYCFKDDIHPIDSVEGQLATYQVATRLFRSGRA
ncbi:alpha/beta-hydrolase [Trametopsis cervina]|nr:alpha/beta-hydrolase [Trametopsis cervina]